MLLNAFSINMLASFPASIDIREISPDEARLALLCEAEEQGEGESLILSAVGHADTAAVLTSILGVPVPCRRETVMLQPGSVSIVAQYTGPRLPEGSTTLPEGATIRFFAVTVRGGE